MLKKYLLLCLITLFAYQSLKSQDLLNAIESNNYAAAYSYLKKNPRNIPFELNGTPIIMLATYYSDSRMVQLLVSHGADPKKKGIFSINESSYYGSPLVIAAALGKLEMLKLFIEQYKIPINDKELDAESKTETGWTALQWAAFEGKTQICRYLVEKGADINVNHTSGKETPLICAINNSKPETALYLIDAGANVNLTIAGNINALHLAANLRQSDVVKALAGKIEDIDAIADNGFNPLMLAVYRYHFFCCDALIAHGADPKKKNQVGFSALDYAVNYPLLTEFLKTKKNPLANYNPASLTEYINIAVDLYWSAKYSETKHLLSKILPDIEKQFGSRDTSYLAMLLSYAAISSKLTGDSINAEKYYQKSLDIFMGSNPKSPMTGILLKDMRDLYVDMNNFTKAEKTQLQLLEWNKSNWGELSAQYFQSLNDLAFIYSIFQMPIKSAETNRLLLDLKLKKSGSQNADYLNDLTNLAQLYFENSYYNEALQHYNQAIGICKKLFTEKSREYAKVLYEIASIHYETANQSESEKYYKEAINILEKLFGSNDDDCILSKNGLAILYQSQGNYSKARKIFLDNKDILLKTNNGYRADYAVTLNNLAELNRVSGEYTLSEQFFIEAIKLQKELGLESSNDIATSYNNLALLYYNIGQYEKSEALFAESLRIKRLNKGENLPDFASTLNNLSLIYQKLGNYPKAIILQLQAYKIRVKVFGIIHPSVAVTLNNMALIYLSIDSLESAKIAFRNAIEIQKKCSEDETAQLAIYIDNFGFTLAMEDNYADALPLFEQAFEIRKKLLGRNHLSYGTSLSNLGGIYFHQGNLSKAEKYLNESAEIVKMNMGGSSFEYAVSLIDLGFVYMALKKYVLADSLMMESNNIFKKYNKITEKYMSISEREFFASISQNGYPSIFYSYFFDRQKINRNLSNAFYNNLMSDKGLLLNSNLAFNKMINSSNNAEIIKLRQKYTEVNKKLGFAIDQKANSEIADSLADKANELEKEMLGILKPGSQIQSDLASYDEVRNSLAENEAAVEFVHFKHLSGNRADSIYYCAVVIAKELPKPEVVFLFEEKEMNKLLFGSPTIDIQYAGSNPEYHYIRSIYLNKKNQVDKADSIYQLIWKPIESLLKNKKNVFISPAGIINQIAFDAVPANDSLLLSDVYNLTYLFNTSKLMERKSLNITSINDIVLFGGIEYDIDTMTMKKAAGKYARPDETKFLPSSNDRSFEPDSIIKTRGVVWQNLDATKTEAINIDKLFLSKKIKSKVYSGSDATEEAFKSFSNNSPSVMHIATHGFYFPDQQTNKGNSLFSLDLQYTNAPNPLLRSGLLFAGGNRIWTGEKIPENIEDGVLSAFEVTKLNLMNTKLAVLSACQTGLGDNKGNEGVYGLQRAFKLAGVDYLIVSLWQVPDATTQELMQAFYTYWLQGVSINEAFKKAQNDLKKKYSAYGWAAFVLLN